MFAATITLNRLRRHRLIVGGLVGLGGFLTMLAAAGLPLHRPRN